MLLSILVLISTSKIPHVNFCQRKVQRHVSLESANFSGFSDPFSDSVAVGAARSGLSGRAYPRDSHCRGVHMHTDLRRVFSSVGSFDCQGTGKIKESLPQM